MFVRSSRAHSAVWVSACRSSSLSRPASLALHGGFIKSWDIVGRIDCSLPQLHSVIVKIALSMIRVVNIFHHVAINGPVNHLAFCTGRCRFLLASSNGFLSFFVFRFMLAVYLVAMRIPSFQVTGPTNIPSRTPSVNSFALVVTCLSPSMSVRFPDPGARPDHSNCSSGLWSVCNRGRRL